MTHFKPVQGLWFDTKWAYFTLKTLIPNQASQR